MSAICNLISAGLLLYYVRIMGRRRRAVQLELPARTWGGRRAGAGRKPGTRRRVSHCARPAHRSAHPVHLTLRARAGLPSLRKPRLFAAVRGAIARASRERFRIVHFSVQGNHLHLMVEADDRYALRAGAHGLGIRAARAVNKTLSRKGAVWDDRYHTRALKSPREVRHGLVYVLMNIRKHDPQSTPGIDPCSSAPWFEGFRDRAPNRTHPPPTRCARTWLATTGWRRHGLLSTTEHPTQPRQPTLARRATQPPAQRI
jgi:REP element-mobilizing transposase RayT